MYRVQLFAIVLVFIKITTCTEFGVWKWICNHENKCIRISGNEKEGFLSIEICRLVCGAEGSIWPKPTIKFKKEDELVEVDLNQINFEIKSNEKTRNFIEENIRIFKQNLQKECKGNCTEHNGAKIVIKIEVETSNMLLNWDTDETYTIKTEESYRILKAKTVFGARHGLETLSQLFAAYFKEGKGFLVTLAYINVEDQPYFPHRSILLDPASNFLPLNILKRQIDAMAINKLNILHLRMSNSGNFPFISQRVPWLANNGAMNEKQIYTPEDMKELIAYAKIRSVMVLLEIETPGQASLGWQWGPQAEYGNLTVCNDRMPNKFCSKPPCGQLNPTNPNTYKVLKLLYNDIVDQNPSNNLFHLGGHNINFECWKQNEQINSYLKSKQIKGNSEDFLELWGEFYQEATKAFDSIALINTSYILWSSDLTSSTNTMSKYINKTRFVIETRTKSFDSTPKQLMSTGYKVIIAPEDVWGLDNGFYEHTKYVTWRTAYNYQLPKHKNLVGGEATLWGDFIDENSLEVRLWPRASAVAEKLWSNTNLKSKDVEARMHRHRERMVTRGFNAETLTAYWCYQNEAQCL